MHFVLIHGAWHDERAWYPVARLLRGAGHEVTTPTLTGLGLRAAELSPSVGLRDHVRDVVAHLERYDLDDVVLVAHSYGAVVAREAAAATRARIRQLVLVEGWSPSDGQSLADIAPDWFMPAMQQSADQAGDGWRIPAPSPSSLGITDPALAVKLAGLLTDHPLKTFTESTSVPTLVEEIPCVAVVGLPGLIPFEEWAVARGWPILRVESGHEAPFIAPESVAASLLEAVS